MVLAYRDAEAGKSGETDYQNWKTDQRTPLGLVERRWRRPLDVPVAVVPNLGAVRAMRRKHSA